MYEENDDDFDVGSLMACFVGGAPHSDIYKAEGKNKYVFGNPLYTPGYSKGNKGDDNGVSNMRLKDFLAAIPIFSDFTDQQLVTLESRATICSFKEGDIVFRQGDAGDAFYVLHKGSAEVLINFDKGSSSSIADLGRVVSQLTAGDYFGERALMNDEPRAASIRITSDGTVCLVSLLRSRTNTQRE